LSFASATAVMPPRLAVACLLLFSPYKMKALSSAFNETGLRVLTLLENRPDTTQRELSYELGISLGSVNYCLKGLVEKGYVKVKNFKANPNKLGYLYLLTPSGIAEKSRLTERFIQRRLTEYRALQAELTALAEAGLVDAKDIR
jgi:EPS-associated MarR family transcriptional regulator